MEKRKQDPRRDLCANVYDDDGINPRLERKDHSSRSTLHKDRQLCKQIMTALNAALQGEAASPLLRDLLIVRVDPAPDSSRIRVTVHGPAIARVGAPAALESLRRARGFLRLAIGDAIARKRVPELIFAVAPEHEEKPDET